MIPDPFESSPCGARLEPAGFPSPAADFKDAAISLDRALISHPAATFFFRAGGSELESCGIFDGDLLIVDRAVAPAPGRMLLLVADGEFRLAPFSRLGRERQGELEVWGVVRWAIHRL